MIKLAIIINYLKNGGPSRIVLNLVQNLDINKFDVTIVTLKNKNDDSVIKKLKEKDVKVLSFDYTSNVQIIKDLKNIKRKIKSLNGDLVHTHGFLPDLIVSNLKLKKISTLHSNINEDYLNFYGKLKGNLYCYIHKKILNKFECVCCCSESAYNGLKNDIDEITFIRNGIDFEINKKKNLIREELSITNDSIVYIFCGRLVSGKRILEMIELFKKAKSSKDYLLILGAGPLYDKIKHEETSNIKVLGFKKNIYDYYCASDIYISNSASEGFSISVIEALGCGLLLLVSDIPSHIECFEIDNEVYIGEYFNQNNFASKKYNLEKRIKQIDKKALVSFQQKHLSGKTMSNEYSNLYSKIIKKK